MLQQRTTVMSFERTLNISGVEIGPAHPTYFIADIAANHDGDLARAKDLIYLCAEAGASAAKFQHFTAATIVSDRGFRELDFWGMAPIIRYNKCTAIYYRDRNCLGI